MKKIRYKKAGIPLLWNIIKTGMLLLVMLGISLYSLPTKSAEETNTLRSAPMPGDIGNIIMAMPLKDLIAIRKNLKNFDFTGNRAIDTDEPDASLFEDLDNTALFDHVLYGFENFLLSHIVLFAEKSDSKNQHRDLFLKQVLKLYGDPDEIVVVHQPIKEAYNAPGLIWRQRNLLLMADFTLDSSGKRSGYYQLKIFDMNMKAPKPLYMVPVLEESEKAKIIAVTDSLLASLR